MMPPCSKAPDEMEEEIDLTQRKNVVFAVNYEVSMVDQFLAQSKQRKQRSVEAVHNSTSQTVATKYSQFDDDDDDKTAPNPVTEDEGTYNNNDSNTRTTAPSTTADSAVFPLVETNHDKSVAVRLKSPTPTRNNTTPNSRRKSARERPQRGLPLARTRVRYDMQLVPPAARSRVFLQQFEAWWQTKTRQQPVDAPRRSSRLNTTTHSTEVPVSAPCTVCDASMPPFLEDASVIWIPSTRSEWEDSVSELTAVCTSAAIRRYSSPKNAATTTKPFHAPLSRDYIRDRVDIDDPLNGYQLRHKTGGWLQGFVLWTNFTTWTHYFKWDSQHPMSGMSSTTANDDLTDQLEAQPRSGDPHLGGVVFPTIAEIGLLGGLGCGEYMLRMALESIRAAGTYSYVVLQATDSSKTFYERFGFERVGAICRYGKTVGNDTTTPVQGYRHWTHANESERSLQKHGGPSYMMCLKLPTKPTTNDCPTCACQQRPFLQQMLDLAVSKKPTIEQLGAATPLSKGVLSRRNSAASLSDVQASAKRGRKVAASTTPRREGGKQQLQENIKQPQPSLKHSLSMDSRDQPPTKRRRTDNRRTENVSRNSFLTPPGQGKSLTYAQKQYQSVWLAVPPATEPPKVGRAPPKRRASMDPSATTTRSTAPIPKKPRSAKAPIVTRRSHPHRPLVLGEQHEPVPINKATLCKQKVTAYPRSRIHYFNRVVKANCNDKATSPPSYYFVLHYDESAGLIQIVPMVPTGTLSGKRQGRPRYQVELGDTDKNFLVQNACEYQVVSSAMVMKTPVLSYEAWDIEDEDGDAKN